MSLNRTHFLGLICLTLATLSNIVHASEMALTAEQQLAEDILRELVGLESTEERPDETRKSIEAVARRLVDAGIPEADVVIVNPEPDLYGLIARLRGIQEQAPLLTMAHIDVVTANPDAWAFPPFSFGKKDGYYYGRGTQDNKTGVAHLVASFIRLQQEGFVPNRDLIMMITGDEETAGKVADWMVTEARELIDAEFALNTDGGGGEYDEDFKPVSFNIQTSEKVYQTYVLSTSNPGGHSSIPRPENAISELAQAVVNISAYQFPVKVSANTQLMFARTAEMRTGQEAADMKELSSENFSPEAAERLSQNPYINAILRTTCIPTRLSGGHAENALPRDATATVNCRILPGTDPAEIRARLVELIDNPAVKIHSIFDAKPSPASVMPAALQESLETLVEAHWPGVPVIPEMSTGATDGLFLRNAGIPVFGVAGWFMRPGDIRAHGLDEKIGMAEFHAGTDFWYQMLKTLSQP